MDSNGEVDDGSKYPQSFYDHSCEDLAKNLLGKTLVRKLSDGTRLAGIIVETEAYLGGDDKASHSYDGKKTAKNEAMFMDPGTFYVYSIYGSACVNISARG
jgi:DNA-3-methyladenine glycosylase